MRGSASEVSGSWASACHYGAVPDAPPTYYFSLGRMICRAAEAEHMMEALLVDLDPATEPKKVRGLPAGNTRKR
jgi:hypothetical protein